MSTTIPGRRERTAQQAIRPMRSSHRGVFIPALSRRRSPTAASKSSLRTSSWRIGEQWRRGIRGSRFQSLTDSEADSEPFNAKNVGQYSKEGLRTHRSVSGSGLGGQCKWVGRAVHYPIDSIYGLIGTWRSCWKHLSLENLPTILA